MDTVNGVDKYPDGMYDVTGKICLLAERSFFLKTLFIGNSHTFYNDMPAIYQQICKEHGIDMHVTMLTKGGMGLDFHADQEQTRFNILYGGYDIVVLQHTAHPMGDIGEMKRGARKIMQWIREAGARPIFYQTWAAKGDEAYQPVMSKVYFELADELGAEVAPVGDEWQRVQKECPSLNLFHTDGQHASPDGSRLAARVFFETAFPGGKQ